MIVSDWYGQIAAAMQRWREDRATLRALVRLEPRSRAEFETLVRLWRDGEFESKGRSVGHRAPSHIASAAHRAHS